MKAIFLVALACFASASALPADRTAEAVAREIASAILGARISVPDPLLLNHTEITVPEDLQNLVTGVYTIDDGVITGLGAMVDDIKVSATLKITVKLDIPVVRVTGAYTANGEAHLTTGDFVLTGAGQLEASVEKLSVHATAQLVANLITNRAVLTNMELHGLSMETASVFATGALANGKPVEWDEVNKDLKPLIDAYLADAKKREELTKIVQKLLNQVLGRCTIGELLGAINGNGAECLKGESL